jgi:hypothetical protein
LHFEPAHFDGDTEEFGFSEVGGPWSALQRRRRSRLIRFIVWELFAVAVLLSAVAIGLSHRLPDDPIALIAKIVAITGAVAVAIIPIVFYGLPETLPRD